MSWSAKKKANLSRVAKKNAKMSRFYGVLVELRWRSLNGLECEKMQQFNTTNVVLNSIRPATPFVKVADEKDHSLEKFGAENRPFVLVCEEKS